MYGLLVFNRRKECRPQPAMFSIKRSLLLAPVWPDQARTSRRTFSNRTIEQTDPIQFQKEDRSTHIEQLFFHLIKSLLIFGKEIEFHCPSELTQLILKISLTHLGNEYLQELEYLTLIVQHQTVSNL